jgi:hypothetical protein
VQAHDYIDSPRFGRGDEVIATKGAHGEKNLISSQMAQHAPG